MLLLIIILKNTFSINLFLLLLKSFPGAGIARHIHICMHLYRFVLIFNHFYNYWLGFFCCVFCFCFCFTINKHFTIKKNLLKTPVSFKKKCNRKQSLKWHLNLKNSDYFSNYLKEKFCKCIKINSKDWFLPLQCSIPLFSND